MTKVKETVDQELDPIALDYESMYNNLLQVYNQYQKDRYEEVEQYKQALDELNKRYGRVLKLYNELFNLYVTETSENK